MNWGNENEEVSNVVPLQTCYKWKNKNVLWLTFFFVCIFVLVIGSSLVVYVVLLRQQFEQLVVCVWLRSCHEDNSIKWSKRSRIKVLTPSAIYLNQCSLHVSYLYDNVLLCKKFGFWPFQEMSLEANSSALLPLVYMYCLTILHFARNIIVVMHLIHVKWRQNYVYH